MAQVYKWVDEKGVTHYGEHPPPGEKAREVEQHLANPGRTTGKTDQPSWKEKDLQFRSRRIESEQIEAKQRQQLEAQRRDCNQARDHLAQLKSARRVYHLDEKGERVFQSDEERGASIAQAEQAIAQHCR